MHGLLQKCLCFTLETFRTILALPVSSLLNLKKNRTTLVNTRLFFCCGTNKTFYLILQFCTFAIFFFNNYNYRICFVEFIRLPHKQNSSKSIHCVSKVAYFSWIDNYMCDYLFFMMNLFWYPIRFTNKALYIRHYIFIRRVKAQRFTRWPRDNLLI